MNTLHFLGLLGLAWTWLTYAYFGDLLHDLIWHWLKTQDDVKQYSPPEFTQQCLDSLNLTESDRALILLMLKGAYQEGAAAVLRDALDRAREQEGLKSLKNSP